MSPPNTQLDNPKLVSLASRNASSSFCALMTGAIDASRVELISFLLGTLLGLLPGLCLMALLVDRIQAVVRAPGLISIGTLTLASALVIAVAVHVWRRFA